MIPLFNTLAAAAPQKPEGIAGLLAAPVFMIVLIVIIALVAVASSAKSSQPLVIKEWKANNQPIDTDGNFIVITGRQGGLIAWLLALMKVDPITSIKVSPERVEFASASLSGTDHRMIPILSVCSTYYGYYKPWKSALAIFGVFAFIAVQISTLLDSGFGAFIVFLIGLGVSLAYYFLSRTLTLGIVEHSGVINGIRFKRSVIEGVEISPAQGAYICQIIQFLIESRRANL